MKRNAREFIRSTTTLLDHVLPTLTQEEQHELLDALAGEIEERLDALVEAANDGQDEKEIRQRAKEYSIKQAKANVAKTTSSKKK